jgi:alpha-ketoglutarate-dependent taurine dioxygenase
VQELDFMEQNFKVTNLDRTFGATVTDIKLTDIDDKTTKDLYRLWLDRSLLIFPDQHLTNEQQVRFAERFGKLEFDLSPISNVRTDGTVRDANDDDIVKSLKGNMEWHHDSTYMPVQAKGAVFTAHQVPSKEGRTGWADMTAAYEALDQSMKDKVENLSAIIPTNGANKRGMVINHKGKVNLMAMDLMWTQNHSDLLLKYTPRRARKH